MGELVAIESGELVVQGKATTLLPEHKQKVDLFAAAALSENTIRAYRSDWSEFEKWAAKFNYATMPAHYEVVASFVAEQVEAGVSVATVKRRIASIRCAHEYAGFTSPTLNKKVADVVKAASRAYGVRPNQKTPLTAAKVHALLANCSNDLQGLRDRALLLLGFAGAFRRSELVALQVEDINQVPEGFRVLIRQSKTDQEGHGQEVAIYNGGQFGVGQALQAWLAAAGITEGALFRSFNMAGELTTNPLPDYMVARIVKKYAELAGFDKANFAGHSLRAGFLTSAAEAGSDIFKMMEVSRHKRMDTVRGYVRSAELFNNHAGAKFL